MIAYNLPSLTMCIVQPTAEYTTALDIPQPADFYLPKTLWKLQMSGQSGEPFTSGMRLARRILLGDLVISELWGVGRGGFSMAFSDTLTFMMYQDSLFDVSGIGFNSCSPVAEAPKTGAKEPRSAIAEVTMCHVQNPGPDRTKPFKIQFHVMPISGPATVILEQLTITQIT
jgi:hypothetical protein